MQACFESNVEFCVRGPPTVTGLRLSDAQVQRMGRVKPAGVLPFLFAIAAAACQHTPQNFNCPVHRSGPYSALF